MSRDQQSGFAEFRGADTIIDGMRPQTVGRVLGTGLRVAGRIASQRLASSPQPASRPVTVAGVGGPSTTASVVRPATRQAGRATGSIARGMGGFLRPFRRLGDILFLEVTGAFFCLFALTFGNWAWKARAGYAHGPDHTRFLTFAAIALVFLYLGASSFWRARRK